MPDNMEAVAHTMPLSELEANISGVGFEAKTAMQRILSQKVEVDHALRDEDLPVLDAERLKGMKQELESAIQQYRFSGMF